MYTSVTSTRSKVKVTKLPKLRKLHFSMSFSSAVFVWSSKLMVGGNSMGHGIQPIWGPIFEFPSRKAITTVQTSRNVDISRHSNGHISVVREATVRWLNALVVLQVLCMLIWLDPIQGQGQGHGAFELPKISKAVHACWRRWPSAPFLLVINIEASGPNDLLIQPIPPVDYPVWKSASNNRGCTSTSLL